MNTPAPPTTRRPTVLLTGATGCVASHIGPALGAAGWSVLERVRAFERADRRRRRSMNPDGFVA
jgi:nucleoside-diphosphate-sugar epimerase